MHFKFKTINLNSYFEYFLNLKFFKRGFVDNFLNLKAEYEFKMKENEFKFTI